MLERVAERIRKYGRRVVLDGRLVDGAGSGGLPSVGRIRRSLDGERTDDAAENVRGDGTDVCSLMTAAQASEINEVTYSGTSPKHVTTGYEQCTYTNSGTSVDPVNIYDLEVGVVSVDGCYQQFKDADGPGTAVPGVGDAAFGYQIGITVQDGSTCIQVEGSTHAELKGDYSHDVAMAKIILAALH